MTGNLTHHDTIVFERIYNAPIARVYTALADPAARARWSAPSESAAFIYDETDFRVGGRDVFRCGSKSDPRYRGETRYHDIIPERRIVSTEVIDELGRTLSVAATTVEFAREGSGTRLKLTVQLVSLEGRGMIDGTRTGYAGALDNLENYLASRG